MELLVVVRFCGITDVGVRSGVITDTMIGCDGKMLQPMMG